MGVPKVILPPVYAEVPLLAKLAEKGVECDQILAEAIRRASMYDWDDRHLLVELARAGSPVVCGMHLLELIAPHGRMLSTQQLWQEWWLNRRLLTPQLPSSCHGFFQGLYSSDALLRKPGVVTANAYLAELTRRIQEVGDNHIIRPHAADLLARALTGNSKSLLSSDPRLQQIVSSLQNVVGYASDIELILALDDQGRIRVRPTGLLGDRVQKNDAGLLVPTRAILTLQQTYQVFTPDQIAELEDLINCGNTHEDDLQKFFERFPHFFRTWDHRAVHPHVYLTREADGDGPLIPDFILTHQDAQKAFLVDLKLPGETLITRQKNRERFSAAITEAKAQLTTYRDWFEDKHNREKLKDKVGMAIYRPQLSVIIGRSSEFKDEIDRPRLAASEPSLQVVTYDDILQDAKRRMLWLDGEFS